MAEQKLLTPMVIALFDLGHLSIDLGQDCRSALLGACNGVVGYRRHGAGGQRVMRKSVTVGLRFVRTT